MKTSLDTPQRLALRIIFAGIGVIFPSVLLTVFLPVLMTNRIAQGQIYSTLSLGGLAGTVLAGCGIRRMNPLSLLRTALTGTALCLLVLTTAPLNGILLFGLYAGIATIGVSQMVALPLVCPEIPRRVMALSLAANSTASALFPMLATALLESSKRLGIAPAFALSLGFLLSALGMSAANLGLRHAQISCPTASLSGDSPSKRDWTIIVFGGLLCVLHVSTDNLLYQWSMLHFMSAYAHPTFPPPLILSGYAIAYLIARLSLAALPERRTESWVLIAPGIIGALLLWSSFACGSFGGAAALYVVAALFYGLEYPLLLGRVAQISPRSMPPVIMAGTLGSFTLTALLSPAIGYVAARAGSARPAIALIPFGFLAFGIVAGIWTLLPRLRQTRPEIRVPAIAGTPPS